MLQGVTECTDKFSQNIRSTIGTAAYSKTLNLYKISVCVLLLDEF